MLAYPSDPSSPLRKLPRRTGLTAFEENRLKQRLRRVTCSEPWVEAQIKGTDDVDQDGRRILYRYHDPHVFPPGGADTAMVRCPTCGVMTPPNAMEHGRCLDHADHRGWGPSPSAVAIQALQMLNLRMEMPELPPEDVPSLRKEIRRFEKRQKRKRAQQL